MIDTPPDMKVRISSDLRRKIEASARANNRTMNGEIVARLEASFARENEVDLPDFITADRLDELEKGLAELTERLAAIEKKT